MVDFTNQISVHLARLKKYVDQAYSNVFDMSYFTVAYKELARTVSTEDLLSTHRMSKLILLI